MIKKLLYTAFLSLFSLLVSAQCGCTKIVFIVDNSGSISTTEFTDMKLSMDSIATQLLRNYPGSEMSVIQYASQGSANHHYSVSVPFTSNPVTARNWSRAYGTGGTVATYFQDHLPGSMYQMRDDSIWNAGGTVDLVTGGCNIRMFLFTDALAGSTGAGCCSHLTSVSTTVAPLALADFGEYNLHKSTYQSEWTVYHVNSGVANRAAGAAIASKGGSYTGTISPNPGDPQGAGGPRKLWWSTTFVLTQPDIDTALANINAGSFSASFPTDTICLGDTAYFTSNIVFPTSLLIWNFGDGTGDSSNTSPKHVYTAAGTYNVTLIAWSADSSCKDTITEPVVIHPPLIPDFLADTVCLGTTTTLTNTTSGFINSQKWFFGDGDSALTRPDASHVYALPGVYPVTLVVNSSNICFDTIIKNVLVNDVPAADFTINNECQFLGVTPVNTTTVITANLASLTHTWDFGDGSPERTGTNPTYNYPNDGSYTVRLISETPQGCADTTTQPIVISPKPRAIFTADTACLRQISTFTDLSTVPSGSVVGWNWTFPGGSTTQNPITTYASSGTFPVTLTVTSDSGCIDDTTAFVVVRPLPVPNFTFSPSEILTFNPKVCFTNTSSGAIGYFWDFDFIGLNNTSIQTDPCIVEFPNESEGVYNVKLVAINQYGCRDSIYKEVVVEEGFVFYAPSIFTPNDDGKNDVYQIFMSGTKEFQFMVFNRWGEQIFYTQDRNETWDGKYKGKLVKNDVYVFKAIVTTERNEVKEFYGHITVDY